MTVTVTEQDSWIGEFVDRQFLYLGTRSASGYRLETSLVPMDWRGAEMARDLVPDDLHLAGMSPLDGPPWLVANGDETELVSPLENIALHREFSDLRTPEQVLAFATRWVCSVATCPCEKSECLLRW